MKLARLLACLPACLPAEYRHTIARMSRHTDLNLELFVCHSWTNTLSSDSNGNSAQANTLYNQRNLFDGCTQARQASGQRVAARLPLDGRWFEALASTSRDSRLLLLLFLLLLAVVAC